MGTDHWAGRRGRDLIAAAASAALVLVAGGCASEKSGAGGSSDGGDGVEAGATKEQYQEALADMSPVTLNVQTVGPVDAPNGRPSVDYWDAVEDWSGGKITFEVTPSSGLAPLLETYDALSDGRVDMATVLPSYSPEEFPAATAFAELQFIGGVEPVIGDLANQAAALEVAWGELWDEMEDEAQAAGAHLLLPYYQGGPTAWACTSQIDNFSGKAIRGGTTGDVRRVEAVGATATFVDISEVFEGLQRGVIDCTSSSMQGHAAFGYLSEAGNIYLDPAVNLGRSPAAFAISQAIWEDLPLAAQQLLHDRLDVWLGSNATNSLTASVDGFKTAIDSGGGHRDMPADATEALQTVNDQLADDMRTDDRLGDDPAAVVAALKEKSAAWEDRLRELGLGVFTDYQELATSYSEDAVDISAFVDEVNAEVLHDTRPTAG